jgi:hypothetical protein
MSNTIFRKSVIRVVLDDTFVMDKLRLNDRFQGDPTRVANGKEVGSQLLHTVNKYTRAFRKLNLMLNNGKRAS